MSQDKIHRSVFCTYLANAESPFGWSDFAALQLGVKADPPEHVVLYRILEGPIHDISQVVKFQAGKDAETFDLTLPAGITASVLGGLKDLSNGFAISERSFGNEKAAFNGTLNGRSWKGVFCGIDDIPLKTIQAGKQSIPTEVALFFDITPLRIDWSNRAKMWAIELFEDLMKQSFSDRAKQSFFHDLQPLGMAFAANNNLPNKTLPDILQDTSSPFFLRKCREQNERLFYVSGVHVLCQQLKAAYWLDEEYRVRIKDKASAYFEALSCPEDQLSSTLAVYGNDDEVAKEADKLRSEYMNAVRKCYCAAYICACPSLKDYISSADITYIKTIETVLSGNYKTHWLPLTVDAASNSRAELLRTHLSIMHDKLIMLQMMKGNTEGPWPDIEDIIAKLAMAAKNTGLFGLSDMELASQNFKLDAGNIISVDQQSHLQWLTAMPFDSQFSNVQTPPFDYRSAYADQYLSSEAHPLGLYVDAEKKCIIL